MLDSSGSESLLLPAHSGHSCFLEARWNKDMAQAPTEDPKFRSETCKGQLLALCARLSWIDTHCIRGGGGADQDDNN